MTTVFVVVLSDYYDDVEVLGVAATMAEGRAIAEKRLRQSESGNFDWRENPTHQWARLATGMQRATVQAYDVVGSQ